MIHSLSTIRIKRLKRFFIMPLLLTALLLTSCDRESNFDTEDRTWTIDREFSRGPPTSSALRSAEEVGGAFLQLDLLDHLIDVTADAAQRAQLLDLRGDLLADGIGWQEEARQSREAALAAGADEAGAPAPAQA